MAAIASLDRRFWLVSGICAVGALVILGIPAALIPNPVFGRQLAAEPFAYAVWVASALLAGPILATYLSPAPGARDSTRPSPDPHGGGGSAPVGVGGLIAFLAIGCPICNKVAVGLLGVSGALNVFGPLQPLLGAASLALLSGTLAWRLRARGRPCVRCATEAAEAALGAEAVG